METLARPHRAGVVLGLGIIGLLAAVVMVPVGVAAVILGRRELGGMNRATVDSSGRTPAQVGVVFGWTSCVLLAIACWYHLTPRSPTVTPILSGEQQVVEYYAAPFRAPPVKEMYIQRLKLGGGWMKHGQAVSYRRDGTVAATGTYANGEREGMWRFASEDGSRIDALTGTYVHGVRQDR